MSFAILNSTIPTFNNDNTVTGVTLKSLNSTSLDFVVKRLQAGTNVTLTETGHAVTINATTGAGGVTSIASAGGTSLVASGAAPVPTIKGLTAGANITLTPSGTAITIAASGAGTNVLSTGGPGSSLVFASGPPTAQIKTIQSGDGSINVADAGTSIDLTVLGNPGGVTAYKDVTNSLGNSIIFRAGGGLDTTPTTGVLELKTLSAGAGITIDNSSPFSTLTISTSSMGTTDVEGFPGNNAAAMVFNNGGNPVYILAISGDAYSSSSSGQTSGINPYIVNGGSQVQLDNTITSVAGGTYNMVYLNTSRGGSFGTYSQIKSINVNSTSSNATLSITDDGNGHLTFNLT